MPAPASTLKRVERAPRRAGRPAPARPRALAVGRAPLRQREPLETVLDVAEATPDEAYYRLEAGGTEVVLLDGALPAARLRAVLAAVRRAQPRPALVVWTDAPGGRRASALAAEADEVIAGPTSPSELRARLRGALRMRGFLDEIARQRGELDGLRRQMDALAARMAEDLRVAGGIQRSLLPPPVEHPRLDLAREYIPFREIGGDYYDFVPLREQALALAVGDVMGKGVSAALLAATLKASVRSQLQAADISWTELVSRINRLFFEVTPAGLFASLFFGVFDASGRSFAYVNAGHFHPFVVRRDGALQPLDRGGAVLGLVEDASYAEGEVELDAGDLLVFYSDGVTERSNAQGELYGVERLHEAARRSRRDAARISLYSILGELQGWSDGRAPEDDTTLVVVKVR